MLVVHKIRIYEKKLFNVSFSIWLNLVRNEEEVMHNNFQGLIRMYFRYFYFLIMNMNITRQYPIGY